MEAMEYNEDYQMNNHTIHTIPTKAGSLKLGGFVVIEKFPCKITEFNKTKDGKHGHAKVTLTGIDVFTGKKYTDCCPAHSNIDVPVIKRVEYPLQDIDDGYLSLLNEGGSLRNDIKLPKNELGKQIEHEFNEKSLICIVQVFGDQEMVISYKEDKD